MWRKLSDDCVCKLFLQARFKDKGSEIASEQLNQVFYISCYHICKCFLYSVVVFMYITNFTDYNCVFLLVNAFARHS